MKFLGKSKNLCLSPHSNDLEPVGLGTTLKFKNTEFKILILLYGGKLDKKLDFLRQFKTQIYKEPGGKVYFAKEPILSFHKNYISKRIGKTSLDNFRIIRSSD